MKKDKDYLTGVKVACVVKTSKANNGHHTSYLNQMGRTIVTGVECTWQRLTAGVSLLLVSQVLVENVMETIFAL